MRVLLSLLLCVPLLALDNGITVYEASGSAQTARPMTVYRSFAQGEFASGTYPKPRIAGTAPSAWQVDVKTTWPDGSVQMAYVSFRLSLAANGSAAVDFIADSNPCHLGNTATCQAAALTQQGMLDYNTGGGAGSWSASWYGTMNSIEHSALARTMLNAGAWRWMLQGPVVSAVIVEDRTAAFAYDFGWQYSGGAWVDAPNSTYKSLHPVFEIRFYPDPDGAGALTAWGGVEVDAQLWNASTLRLQRFDSIDLTLKTGNAEATTAYSVTAKSFHARSRRHKLTWSGTAPGAMVIDYNFQYLIHTKLIGPYDYSLAVANTLADYDLGQYATNLGSDEPQWCSSSSFCGNWRKSVSTTGARGDIALTPGWYLDYLYVMGHSGVTVADKLNAWNKLVVGNADAAGHVPIHYMESASTKTFFSVQDTTNAVGRVGSINARHSWYAYWDQETPWTDITYACSSDPCDARLNTSTAASNGGWGAQGSGYVAHAPSFYSIPAFLTGYHYYLTGVQFQAAFLLATTNSCTNGSSCRHAMYGVVYYDSALRGTAWVVRDLLWAAALTPDGDIEKAYFKEKLVNNAKFTEGVMLLTTGAHAPTNTACPAYARTDGAVLQAGYDLWCAGRYWWTDGPGIPASNPLHLSTYGSTQTSTSDGYVTGGRRTTGFWQSYLGVAWGWVASTGAFLDVDGQPVFKHVRDAQAAHFAGRVLSSPKSMYLLRDIEWGIGGTGAICTTFDDCAGSYATSYTLGADMTDSQSTLVINSTDIRSTGDYWLEDSWWKIDSEFIRSSGLFTANSPSSSKSTITTQGRGQWGSAAATHSSGATVTWIPGPWKTYTSNYTGGYPVLARAALAMLAEARPSGDYSPIAAYRVYAGALPAQAYASNPLWAVMPREAVSDVVATGGSGTANLSWLAPSGAGCNVYLGTSAPSSSQDGDGETVDLSLGRQQSVAATGLSAGTHYYRITCGTARVSGTVEVME